MQALPLLLLIGLILFPDPAPKADVLEDFARVQRLTSQEIYVADRDGDERFGALVEASEQGLRLRIGKKVVPFEKDTILEVDRYRDRETDGVIKGMLFGLAMGLVGTWRGSATWDKKLGYVVLPMVVTYGALGYAFDHANAHRTPAYRAPAPALTASFRF